jgi:hypothetical protein
MAVADEVDRRRERGDAATHEVGGAVGVRMVQRDLLVVGRYW